MNNKDEVVKLANQGLSTGEIHKKVGGAKTAVYAMVSYYRKKGLIKTVPCINAEKKDVKDTKKEKDTKTEKVISLANQGKTINEIVDEVGGTKGAVAQMVYFYKKRGLIKNTICTKTTRKYNILPEEMKDKILELNQNGMSYAEIGRQLKISMSTAQRHCKTQAKSETNIFDSIHKGMQYAEMINAVSDPKYIVTLPGQSLVFENILLEVFQIEKLFVVEKDISNYVKLNNKAKNTKMIPYHGKLEDFLMNSKIKFDLIYADFCGMASNEEFEKNVIESLNKKGILAITESNRSLPGMFKFSTTALKQLKVLKGYDSYKYNRTMEFRIFQKQ